VREFTEKYRGFLLYPGQHTLARGAAGCSNETEFAAVIAEDLKCNWGANTVMIATGSFKGDNGLINITRKFVDNGIYVILYPQGICYFRGYGVYKWDSSDVSTALNTLDSLFDSLTNQMEMIVGVCVTEESSIFDDNGSGGVDHTRLSPLLDDYWGGIKEITDLPLIYIGPGYQPYLDVMANTLDASVMPDIYLTETYANKQIGGVPCSDRGAPVIDDMIEWANGWLDNVENTLSDYGVVLGHTPMTAGTPDSELTNSGVEYYIPEQEYYRRVVAIGDSRNLTYQICWYFVRNNTVEEIPLRNEKYEMTDIGSGLRNAFFISTRGFAPI